MEIPYLVAEALERDRDRQMSASYEVTRSLINYIYKCLDQVAENPLTDDHKMAVEREVQKFVRSIQKTYGDYARIDEYLRQNGVYDGRGEAEGPSS